MELKKIRRENKNSRKIENLLLSFLKLFTYGELDKYFPSASYYLPLLNYEKKSYDKILSND